MAGPWEKYQAAPSTPAPEGPWSKYRQAAPAAKPEAPSGFAMGLADPFVGTAQMFARDPNAIEAAAMPFAPLGIEEQRQEVVRGVDAAVAKREQDYQTQRRASGEKGIDWGRIGGNVVGSVANPVNLPMMAAPGGAETMLGRLFAGALAGGASALTEPVAGGNFNAEKAKQVGVGAGAGAALGVASKALEPLAKKGEDLFSNLWNRVMPGESGLLRDTSGSLNLPIGGGRAEGGIPGEARAGVPAPPGASVEPLPPGYGAQTPGIRGGDFVERSAPPPSPAQRAPKLPEYRQPANLPISGQVPGKMEPGIPAPPGGKAEPSALASAMASNDGGAIDRSLDRNLVRTYRSAVKPAKAMAQPSVKALDTQDRRIMTAVDQIIRNRNNLVLTDAAGSPSRGALPRSLRQFADALDQNKRSIFQSYDQMARSAGEAGVTVDLRPAVNQLRELASKPEVVDLHPAIAADAERLANTWEARGSLGPTEVQDLIENLNKTLAGFWQNPTHETVSRSGMLAPITRTLREQLDQAIEGAQSPGYQALRFQYQALRSVEKDVAAAVQRQANKSSGGFLGQMADLGAADLMLRGIFTMDPKSLAHAGALKAARAMQKYVNDPNRAIARLFLQRMRTTEGYRPPVTPGMLPAIGGAAAGGMFGQQPAYR